MAGHSGDETTARDLLDHPDAGVRATALHGLARMGKATEDVIAAALADPSPEVRRRALADAVPTTIDLRPLLTDPDPMVAEQAAWALGERADTNAVDDLVTAASHTDALVREAAVAALGALQHEGGRAAILAATADKPAIRRRAVLALAAFDGDDVEAALARAAEDPDWQVRDAADVIIEARKAP